MLSLSSVSASLPVVWSQFLITLCSLRHVLFVNRDRSFTRTILTAARRVTAHSGYQYILQLSFVLLISLQVESDIKQFPVQSFSRITACLQEHGLFIVIISHIHKNTSTHPCWLNTQMTQKDSEQSFYIYIYFFKQSYKPGMLLREKTPKEHSYSTLNMTFTHILKC